MDYRELIKANCEHHSSVPWWPKFAFHITDVKNVVSILSSGYLYSRTNAKKLGLMHNDNASRQVIDMTKTEAAAYVRFYFRPLTPTQYHNEGYKHPALRYKGDDQANIPIPVFFAFDLEKLLKMPGVQFSELAQSGYGSQLFKTAEDFSNFHFDKIYSKGYDENWKDTQKYRHAEILYPSQFEINSCLTAILCRNNVERSTLLNLLKYESNTLYGYYKPIIKLCREDMYECNGLFINECQYHDNTVSISFSNTYKKVQHSRKEMSKQGLTTLPPIKARLELLWLNTKSLLYKTVTETQVDYLNPKSITFTNLPNVPKAKMLQIKFYFEDDLMCLLAQSLSEAELIK